MARVIELTTPLGADVLLFRSMRGREELGRLSEFHLSVLSTRGDINPTGLLGKKLTVKLELHGGGYRYFNGHVTRFVQGGGLGRYHEYHLTVRPWLWFLTRTTDCRIFQDKTVPEIVKEIFADPEHSKQAVFEDGLSGKYSRREYCVQYRESDFDFVSRLLEEEGIYYYFEHQDERHVLKLVDSDSGHKALEHKASIAYYPPGKQVRADEEYIRTWTFGQSIQPGAVALSDYDFVKPKADLSTRARLAQQHECADYEVYDCPGEYLETGDGEHYARVRVDELHAEFERAEAETNVRDIAVGRLFTLTNAARRDQDREYLIVSAEYALRDSSYEAEPEKSADYDCKFTALQSRQQFRPARITPRPAARGLQSAVVVGPGGEEIYCDKYGRIKVQFHWDRYGKRNENSGCWIRIAHQWAGGTWGVISLPRIGQEVIVDFLDGNPDQPLVTGRVYNADQMPPYELPANATQSGIKSRSSKGGGAANFNEIRLEDKKGSEQLFIHAEKNQDLEVENDETHWVGHDRKKNIDNDETTHVKHDRTETVDNNETITVHGARTEIVDKDEKITIHQNRTEQVDIDEKISIGGNRTEQVTGNETIGIDGSRGETVKGTETITISQSRTENVGAAESVTIKTTRMLDVGSDETISVGGARSDSVKGAETISVGGGRSATITGNDTVDISASLSITAKDSITITVGSASITMKSDGTININGQDISTSGRDITTKGRDINTDGSGKIIAKAGGKMTLKAEKIHNN